MQRFATRRWFIGLASCLLILSSIGALLAFFPGGGKPVHAAYNSNLRPQIGVNINNPDQADKEFADAMKSARPQWDSASNPGDGKGAMDANRWPTADASIVVWEGITGMDGTYFLSFNGQATISTSFNYGTFSNQQYDSSTNTTTATMVITDTGFENFSLIFTNTKRTATSATNTGVTNVKLMRPTSEGASTYFDPSVTFTPAFKQIFAGYTVLRFMNGTNWNTSADWSDRTHVYESSQQKAYPGEGEGNNIAYEYIAQLCNETNKDCYINIPAHATNDYVTKVAQLFRYGSDGTNPYTSPQANPAYAPLNSNLNLYIEYSNEVWNWAFQQTSDLYHLAAAEVNTGGSNLNYDNFNNNWQWMLRYYARRVVQISTIFRGVFGDNDMMTRIRPLLEWQYSNMSDTAGSELEFLNSWYNNGDGQQHVSNPHPVNYFVWGGGGAVYYDSGNDAATTVDGIFNAGFPYFGGANTYQSILNTEAAWAHAYGLHDVAYEGGFGVGADSASSADAAAFFDPRAYQTMVTSFNDFAAAGGEVYVAGTYKQWNTVASAPTDPLVRAATDMNNSSYTPASLAQGTAIAASGSTTIPAASRDTNDDYSTSSGGWMDNMGTNSGFLLRISSSGTYSFSLNLGGTADGGKVNIYADGDFVGTVSVPNNGSSIVNVQVGSTSFSSGLHAILLKPADANNVKFGVFQSLVVTAGGSLPTPTPTSTNTPTPIPTTTSTPTPTPTPTQGGGSLPAPWQDHDVGSPSPAGSASYNNGTFTLVGAGADIWNNSDAFNYAYQPLNGDGTIVAQVTGVQNTNGWAKAGVMIRETLSANSTHAMMVLTPGNGAAFQRRTSTGGSSANTQQTGIAAPYWVKLVRSGSTFTGYVSSDGSNWTQVGSDTINMASNVYVGLAVTSHNDGTLCTATFSNVSVTTSGATPTPTPGVTPTPTPGGTQVYISDLTWVSATNGLGSAPNKDMSLNGRTLTINGQTYSKGLGTATPSTVIYDLNGAYQGFLSDVGIDDECSTGTADFQVYLDGKLAYDSGSISGGTIDHISLNLSGINELKLVAAPGSGGVDCGHADWAGTRVTN